MHDLQSQIDHFQTNKWVVIKDFITSDEIELLRRNIDSISKSDNPNFLYDDLKRVRVIERFSKIFEKYGPEFSKGSFNALSTALLGEPSLLHKDRVVLTYPQAPEKTFHKDIEVGKSFVSRFLTIKINLANNPDNRFLSLSAKDQQEEQISVSPRDALVFDSNLIHRLRVNTSPEVQQDLYVIYSPATEGDRYNDFYQNLFGDNCG